MGYDLAGDALDFYWNIWDWPQVLTLAIVYGWEPAGTLRERLF